jgi:DNA-binding NtrC family response regulator
MIARMPKGCAVFLVDDEALIRMMVADMLEELGCRVAAEAGRIDEAVKLARSTEFDLAILDVNVGGEMIFPVAEAIKACSRPLIFATGYGSLPEEFQQYPRLQKPFQLEVLGKMIDETLKGARPSEMKESANSGNVGHRLWNLLGH